ncbi:hypothetical protein B566_EDAN004782 [Ephemera danica]|nr:hypothetical protein B566_EDAN004782 [Ephemera danica]
METHEEYKKRWRSLRITYFSMLVLSMTFNVTMAGVWPYLNKLDPTADKEFLGIAISAVGLGQMFRNISCNGSICLEQRRSFTIHDFAHDCRKYFKHHRSNLSQTSVSQVRRKVHINKLWIDDNDIGTINLYSIWYKSSANDAMNGVNGTALGCPVDVQVWCATTPSMRIVPMVIGFIMLRTGRSFSMTLCQTIYSKVLGHRPQGLWIGVLITFVCLARIVSPILLSTAYVRLGPIWTFSLAASLNAICAFWLHLVKGRLVPPHIKTSLQSKKSDVDNDLEIHM